MSLLKRMGFLAALAVIVISGARCSRPAARPAPPAKPLRVVVMDPLADQLACACIPGYAQRRYPQLCEFLARKLGRPVAFVHAEDLAGALDLCDGKADLIIGRRSLVTFDAAETATRVRPIAMLTDKQGRTELAGLFVVRPDDPAKTIADLAGRTIVFGPADSAETHADAMAALAAAGVKLSGKPEAKSGDGAVALAVIENEADAGVLADWSLPLLEGCGTIDPGSLRVIGRTAPAPFVTVFATARVDAATEKAVLQALQAVRTDAEVLKIMESRDGFVPVKPSPAAIARSAIWPDWRGPDRDGRAASLPDSLPDKPAFLWRTPMTGASMSGVTATTRYVIVSDKGPRARQDIWRCLDADTGQQRWTVRYDAPGELDYYNSPRAAAVIRQGRAYLLGAFGHLLCVRLADGEVLWRRNVVEDFGADPPEWGMCATPLLIGDRLIVNPGALDAALVALDPADGKVLWKTPGAPGAYASFIHATFGGVEQIVGYDAVSLGGWDPRTGKRLWELLPPEPSDFNVPTPIVLDGKLLVATENNGTRLYGFDRTGRIRPKPLAVNEALAPDTATPVVVGGKVFGCFGALYCLDIGAGLKTAWSVDEEVYSDYCSMIGGTDKVLIVDILGILTLIRADGEKYRRLSRLKVFKKESEVWSHPALVNGRLYLRSQDELVCLQLD